MDLNIRYENGSMIVHLEEFIGCRNISKVRKLVKLIRTSYIPDEEQKIKDFIEQEVEQYELFQKENARYVVGYTEKVKFCQKQLDKSIAERSKYTRNSPPWKFHSEYIKQQRQELKEQKALLRSRQSDFDSRLRNKAFYDKVLENLL